MSLLDKVFFWTDTVKQPVDGGEIGTTIPMNYDVGQASYPNASYANFATEGYAKNEIVHACIRELATAAATPRYYIQAPSRDGGIVEVTTGVFYDLINHPNPTDDWYSFIEHLVTYLMVAGNAYVYKERIRTNQVSGLYLLRPDRVRIIGATYGASGYVYEVGGKDHYIDANDLCHLSLPNPGADLYGLSPLQVLARTVNLDLNITDFAKVYFQNAGVPSGLLKLKRRLNTQEEASTIRSRWRSQFGGVGAGSGFHRVAILDEDAEYQQMASAPKDMAMSELRDTTESRICAVFGVPAILVGANVGLQRSTYSNYREARLTFHTETLEPLVGRILRYLNHNLNGEYAGNETLTADWSAMKASLDDKADQTNRVNTLYTGGVITLNEARGQLGYDALAEGDVRRIPAAVFEIADGDDMASIAVNAAPEAVEQSRGLYPTKETVVWDDSWPLMETEEKAPRPARRGALTARRLGEDRETETDLMVPKLQRYFRGVRNRIDGILGRYMERNTTESKDFPFNIDDLLPSAEIQGLAEIIRAATARVSRKTFDIINDSGVAGNLEWDEKLPVVQSALTQAPSRASMIHRTTFKNISRAVEIALERGYTIEGLARGVPDDSFPGLRSLLTETENRARLIARTEIMRTQNQTSCGFYQEQGFQYVRADDPDGDPDDTYIDPGDPYGRTCAERHGQIYTLDQARNIDDHPNGRLNWLPMPRDYKPEETVD